MKNIYIITLILLIGVAQSCTRQMKTYKARLLPSQAQIVRTDSSYLEKSIEYYTAKQYDSAMVALHKAYAFDSTNFIIFYYYGLIYNETGNFENAHKALNKSLKLCSSDSSKRSEIYVALAETELHKGDISKAKQNYLTALQLQPDSKDAKDALLKLED